MESILHKIRFSVDEMGPAEKRIADFLLSHSGEFLGMSISELSQRCGCGDATVVRFSRRVGVSGYQELKLRIASELNSSSAVSREIEPTDSCFEIFRKRIVDISNSLRNTETVLDEEQLELAAETIMNAERIVIFGLGNSAAIAHDASHKFLRLGLAAQSCCDNHMQAIIASHLKRGSVAIGISHSGKSRDIVEALRLCKLCGATTVCITNHGSTPITEVSDISLFTKSEETDYSILAMSSRIAQLAIFDSIYTYIVLRADKASRQAVHNTEFALENKKY
ncbi:MAG: MurR/RpiR family transcriptional regulator [Clostridia bacterium]|nr:MurR/RpiR family transcriptional regulator [Clostridia bacterium]